MTLMQGDATNLWWCAEMALTVLSILCIWYFVISGRERTPTRRRREQQIERYGDIEQNEAPLTRFLALTYIGVALFIVGYLLWTGIEGLHY